MSGPLVTTPSGKIEGTDLGHCLEFRGVPFAAPPIGPLRFRAPQKPESWTGVRKATAFGAVAPQNDAMSVVVRRFLGGATVQSEDCLCLNVWTPAADAGRRPVLVWIHGGAFTLGSGGNELYSGSRLARRGDVVVVTINYRLGAVGFLNADGSFGKDNGIVPNVGLHDQIAALEWVRDHIGAFGGDPERVTVFGESAGGMSVGTLLGIPAAQGLFERAILQSGAAHNVSTEAKAAEVSRLFLEELGANGATPEAVQSAPVAALLAAQGAIADRLGVMLGVLPWQPSVDGTLVPESPYTAIASGRVRPVPTLIGTNKDEWRLFLMGDPRLRTLDEPAFERRVRRTLEAVVGSNDERLALKAVARYGPALGTPLQRWCAFQSDRVFHAPAAMLAERCAASGAPAYTYRFDWVPPMVGAYTGSFHALEIPFVFGTLRGGFLRAVLGATVDARSLSNRMQQSWLSFARDGRPAADNLPAWESFTTENPRTMILAPGCGVREDVHAPAVRFFGPLLDG
ncbi:MAG: carboxylesterase/lipase family protein [Candidatus Binatia bacterium]|nr:carboxylesterase/lipase family protein [Candidatus Binatia bacterium]